MDFVGGMYEISSGESLESARACNTQPRAIAWSGSICELMSVDSGKRSPIRSESVGFLHVPPIRTI